jgi:threonine dehydratase
VRLVVSGADYDDAELAAQKYAHQNGMRFIHAFDDDDVIAGQGTVGVELSQEPLQIGAVIVPVGGGGLFGGTSMVMKALRPEVRMIGVQSEASPAMWAAWQKGEVVETPVAETVADGLAGRYVTAKTLGLAQKFCDGLLLVRESSIKQAMREIYSHHGWRVEGSAAVGVAAILEGKIQAAGRDCIVVLSGGNIAPETFQQQTAG